MSLPTTGLYLITSNKDHRLIGRRLREDPSQLPKDIFHLPLNTSDAFKDSGWIIEKRPGDKYILRARGAPTGVERDKTVSAFLLSEPPKKWVIETTDKANVYLIKTHDGKLGWTITPQGGGDEDSVIKVTDHPDKFDFSPAQA
ncbi:hypothetical protein K474DRAFT_618855 [Panus rudis PR-1116 ss-1]|nr:hypothetical protein K474DRAFT_618855 [Panus rudis PR-1116 ss-1]